MLLSICIPTYNRSKHLRNCLHSINIACRELNPNFKVEICISDNCSTDDTESVVRNANLSLPYKYTKNEFNLGIPRNFLNVIAMAEGEFAWLLGDDDLLLPDTFPRLAQIIHDNPCVDFFYVNSYHLHTEYLSKYPAPFDTGYLPDRMEPFSSFQSQAKVHFIDLIHPQFSFDFLGGMFLSVFRKSLWDKNVHVLDHHAITDNRIFSHFDNTFPHVKIFAFAFSKSTAYFNKDPMSVCLSGAREWSPMYPFVRSIRLIEALDLYRKNGLPLSQYIYCKNYALKYSIPDLIYMVLKKDVSGYCYVNPLRFLSGRLLYPNFYFSFLYLILRFTRKFISKISSLSTSHSS